MQWKFTFRLPSAAKIYSKIVQTRCRHIHRLLFYAQQGQQHITQGIALRTMKRWVTPYRGKSVTPSVRWTKKRRKICCTKRYFSESSLGKRCIEKHNKLIINKIRKTVSLFAQHLYNIFKNCSTDSSINFAWFSKIITYFLGSLKTFPYLCNRLNTSLTKRWRSKPRKERNKRDDKQGHILLQKEWKVKMNSSANKKFGSKSQLLYKNSITACYSIS